MPPGPSSSIRIATAIDVNSAVPTPFWEPLKSVVPETWLGGFMYGGTVTSTSVLVHLYKHGITRSSLGVDGSGKTYTYDTDQHAWIAQPHRTSIGLLMLDLALLGVSPLRRYDSRFISNRNEQLRALGYEVID